MTKDSAQRMPAEADVVIVGNGALAHFAALAARRRGLSVLVAGEGQPFDRFLLLHENALRVLEAHLGHAPGHALEGVRVVDAQGRHIRDLPFARHGLRLHAMRLSALWSLLRDAHDAPVIHGRAQTVHRSGEVTLSDGTTFRARRMVINTVSAFTRPVLSHVHGKVFRMGFVTGVPETDRAVQINDAGCYALIVPFGDEAAVVHWGERAPLARHLGQDVAELTQAQEGWMPLRIVSCWRRPMQEGCVFHVGEALRRVHPHTGQGLNRALDLVDGLIARGHVSWRDRLYDAAVLGGGLLLDRVWGVHPRMTRMLHALLATAPGLRLASGTAGWRWRSR